MKGFLVVEIPVASESPLLSEWKSDLHRPGEMFDSLFHCGG